MLQRATKTRPYEICDRLRPEDKTYKWTIYDNQMFLPIFCVVIKCKHFSETKTKYAIIY